MHQEDYNLDLELKEIDSTKSLLKLLKYSKNLINFRRDKSPSNLLIVWVIYLMNSLKHELSGYNLN